MINWAKRIAEWRVVMAQKGVKVSIVALARAVLSGPVPADVWRDRIRVCLRCPIFDRQLKACRHRSTNGQFHRDLGCGCYVPFKALTAAPYPRGCWARQVDTSDREGWPAHTFPSRRAKLRAVGRFLLCRS